VVREIIYSYSDIALKVKKNRQIQGKRRFVGLTKRYAGCCRLVYNKALAPQKERQEKGEKFYSYTDLANMLPVWKQDPTMFS
jgi:hypothetical protein